MTIIIAGIFVLVGIALAIYFIGSEPDAPIKLRAILSVSSLDTLSIKCGNRAKPVKQRLRKRPRIDR